MKDMKQSYCLLFLAAFLVQGCSLFQTRSEKKPQAKELDVSVSAREDDGALRQRVLVLPFLDDKSDRPKTVVDEARAFFVRELHQSGRLVIISNQDLAQDPSKLRSDDGGYDMEAVSKLAAALGVAAVVEGRILEVRVRKTGDAVGMIRKMKAKVFTTVRLRMFAARNGKEILNQTRTAEGEDSATRIAGLGVDRPYDDDPQLVRSSIRDAFESGLASVFQVLEKLTWEGRVALISGERVFLNAGRLSGLQVGDILKVTDEGDEVYDPQTGTYIGKAPGRMKGTVEVVSYFGKDGAIAIVHSGSGFRENDRVELY